MKQCSGASTPKTYSGALEIDHEGVKELRTLLTHMATGFENFVRCKYRRLYLKDTFFQDEVLSPGL